MLSGWLPGGWARRYSRDTGSGEPPCYNMAAQGSLHPVATPLWIKRASSNATPVFRYNFSIDKIAGTDTRWWGNQSWVDRSIDLGNRASGAFVQ